MKTVLKRIFLAAVVYFGAMAVFCGLGYIGRDVVLPIYLPLFLLVLVALLIKKNFLAWGMELGVILGLTAEYIHHLSRDGRPNMGGVLMNTTILLLCNSVGILIQGLADRRKKRKKDMEDKTTA